MTYLCILKLLWDRGFTSLSSDDFFVFFQQMFMQLETMILKFYATYKSK